MGSMEKKSKSDKVYNFLQAYIDENRFSGSQKLPSENMLCRRLDLSRETVRAAIDRLEAEGFVYRVRGSGTYFYKDATVASEPGVPSPAIKIGLILQGQDGNANSRLIRGVKAALKDREADLRFFFTDNKFASERSCLEVVAHQNFDGFIVDGVKASLMNPNLDCYRRIFHKKIPAIFYNNYYKELKYPKVINNDMKCAEELLWRLIKAGHKHIAGIFVYDNYQSIEKFQGYVGALRRHGVEFDDDYVKWCVSNEAHRPEFAKEIQKFLKKRPKCTAVVCCNYMILQSVKLAVKNIGKSVPEDYSVVCFDYSDDDWEEAGITCSVHLGYEMGREVGGRLLKMIENREFYGNEYSYIFKPKIYEGRSVKVLN